MKKGTVLLFFFLAAIARAQDPIGLAADRALRDAEEERHARLSTLVSPATKASAWFDVTSYEIRLRVSASPKYLRGSVRVRGLVRSASASELTLDLSSPMIVDSVTCGGARLALTRLPDAFSLALSREYALGEEIDLTVWYEGLPVSTGFGSFEFSLHGGVPWIWSLSEPYGAKDWWPCKDAPEDKADSVDMFVTCDARLKVGSNGTLRSVVDNPDSTRTHHWHEGYPIATYLVSVAMTDYAAFSNWFVYAPGDSMEVLHYVLPERVAAAAPALGKTVDMLRIFSELYGLYPFVREKYGHADIGKGGAMEHQTMTSTTTYDEGVIAHELGHQWFGDLVTCRTWPHLWLNEGFAQYSTALYNERKYGTSAYWGYMNTQLNVARSALGTLVLADTSSVNTMFPSAKVYAKGAVVLHMLRHVLGDSVFFRSLRAYAADSALAYGSATTEDFQGVCERTSGRALGWFFEEWAYGENSPQYGVSWSAEDTIGGVRLQLSLAQSTGTSNPAFFTMPLDVKVTDGAGDTLLSVWNDRSPQSFSWLLPRRPSSVTIDPGNWVLKTTQLVTPAQDAAGSPGAFRLGENYPNPFNGETTLPFTVPSRGRVSVEIWNVTGELVGRIVEGDFAAGTHRATWQSASSSSGLYIARATFAPEGSILALRASRKLLLVK
jgi:aminopeptidase N